MKILTEVDSRGLSISILSLTPNSIPLTAMNLGSHSTSCFKARERKVPFCKQREASHESDGEI